MQKKKENLLEKIVKKNYNNKLEEVLEHKKFSEQTKSLLLSMLYKIESAYPDYAKVKQNVETKEEYIENIISIIQNQCSDIEVINPRSPRSEELGRRIFVIDSNTKSIKCYPVERKLLYAISKIGKRDYIVDKEKYSMLAKPMSDLIKIGDNINTVEPLRDFNGYSWTVVTREIESIEYNLIYQNLRILLGYKFLKDWINNREFIADYMSMFKKNLRNLYGEKNGNNIKELIFKLAILLNIKFDEQGRKELSENRNEIISQLQIIDDNKLFAESISNQKRVINDKIKQIDTVLNNQGLLQREAQIRNIYNLQILSEQLIREREIEFTKIDNLNKLLLPKNFINYKKELIRKQQYIQLLEIGNLDIEIKNAIMELQKVFLKCFEMKIEQARTKTDVTQLIYQFRYYYLLPFDSEKSILEVKELEELTKSVIKKLIERMKFEGIVGEFSKKPELEMKIFETILSLKTIRLEDIYATAIKDKESNKISMILYDEEEFEQKIELGSTEEIQKKDLGIKLNKRVKVFY